MYKSWAFSCKENPQISNSASAKLKWAVVLPGCHVRLRQHIMQQVNRINQGGRSLHPGKLAY